MILETLIDQGNKVDGLEVKFIEMESNSFSPPNISIPRPTRAEEPGVLDSTEEVSEALIIDTPSKNPTAWKPTVMECANLY